MFIAVVLLNCFFVFCQASGKKNTVADKIFGDTISYRHIIIHHHFDAGAIFRLGREHVRTYNDYDHTISPADNYIVDRYARFLMLRMAHGIVLKKTFEAGVTYGTDISPRPHDTRAFIPLMLHVLDNIGLTKKLALLVTERDGYAFYLRSKIYDPFIKYTCVEGGFTSETLVGLSIQAKHKNYLQLMFGYRFQQLTSKSVFYPDKSLIQAGGMYANLPNKITEISTGLYHFVYLSMGVPF